MAYCVTCVIPAAREAINDALEADPLILSYSLEAQLTKLFFEPLQLLVDQGHFSPGKFPPLVLIDGLDECLDKDAQTNLIQLLSFSVARYRLPCKFLIASRPEPHLKSAISVASERAIISRLELNDDFKPDEDIRRFLTDKFGEIKKCHEFRSQVPPFWPSEQQIKSLIYKASGQFIYAALAMRFINSPCDSPTRQLDIVLGIRPPINNNLPFAELDALYAYILSCSRDIDLVLRILGVHSVFMAMDSNERIEPVLSLEDGDVGIYLNPLSSLLKVRRNSIAFYHSSFLDFLYSQERSQDYYIDVRESRALIVRWVLQAFTCNGK